MLTKKNATSTAYAQHFDFVRKRVTGNPGSMACVLETAPIHAITQLATEATSLIHLTAGVAVEDEVVLSARRKTSDLVLDRKGLDTGGESSRGLLTLKSEEVSSKTSNVGSSHGSTGDGVLHFKVSLSLDYMDGYGSNLRCHRSTR